MYLFLDLEWNNYRYVGGKLSEIIEIGAVLTDSNLKIISEFQQYVKPVGEILKRITKLTGISQELLENSGISFKHAAENLFTWINLNCGKNKFTLCIWGKKDIKVFRQNNKYHKSRYSLAETHINLQEYVADKMDWVKIDALSLSKVYKICCGKAPSSKHNGLDDARSCIDILKHTKFSNKEFSKYAKKGYLRRSKLDQWGEPLPAICECGKDYETLKITANKSTRELVRYCLACESFNKYIITRRRKLNGEILYSENSRKISINNLSNHVSKTKIQAHDDLFKYVLAHCEKEKVLTSNNSCLVTN